MNAINNRQSHNDYWNGVTTLWRWIWWTLKMQYINNRQFELALLEDCNIIECDIICRKGKLLLSHTPFKPKFLCYGELDYYFKKMLNHIHQEVYLYIEIKTSDYLTIELVRNLIDTYGGKIKILIGGKDKWFSRKREYIATEIYFQNLHKNVEIFEKWKQGKEIERVELYKNKSWYKKLNYW